MKTDPLFYELFQSAPQIFFELLQITPACPYRFESITVKSSEKRIDGVFEPVVAGQPIYFLEIQAFPDETIYWRALREISAFFEQRPMLNETPWQAFVLWLNKGDDLGFGNLAHLARKPNPHLSSLDLMQLLKKLPDQSLAKNVLRPFLIKNEGEVRQNVVQWIQNIQQTPNLTPVIEERLIDVLSRLIEQKFKRLNYEELTRMLRLTPYRETISFQTALKEDRIDLLCRLIRVKFNLSPDLIEAVITDLKKLEVPDLDALSEQVILLNHFEHLETWITNRILSNQTKPRTYTRYTINLPLTEGVKIPYTLREPRTLTIPSRPFTSRVAYAAAHVVADPRVSYLLDPNAKSKPAKLSWEATLEYRHYLWSLGFGVAEAMDTAQRGMGLDWTVSKQLIRRSLAEAKSVKGVIACGAGTDHLTPSPERTIDEVIAAYEEQVGYVEGLGGRVILMASRALAACAKGPDDYARVYVQILRQVKKPVILHWLGDMFDPQLAGYWGSPDLSVAMETCLNILHENAAKIDGIKISLLDAQREITMRRRLPAGVKMYTGDDFNYPQLIEGDAQGYSHALLGIFDAIAPVAAAAFHALDAGDLTQYHDLLDPTLALSRHIFQTPTYHYKTGIVFLAWLNGHQSYFRMVGGQHTARSPQHLAQLFVLADQAGLLRDPEMAVERMKNAGLGE